MVITDFLYAARARLNLTADSGLPSVIIGNEVYRRGLVDARKRGVRIRIVTDIAKDNVSICKQLAEICELRHMEGIKANFGVSEFEYLSIGTQRASRPISQVVYSNAKEIVEQQEYVFESFWNRALPARNKIREIEGGTTPVVTKIICDPVEVVKRAKYVIDSSDRLSACSPFDGLQALHDVALDSIKEVLDRHAKGKHNGVRWIGTINDKKDAEIAKTFLNMGMQIRHARYIPLNFSVTDKEFNFTVSNMEGGHAALSVLASNDPVYVAQFNALFEELWGQSVDALLRIKEVEEGQGIPTTEVIESPARSLAMASELMRNAKKEVLVLLSTQNAFRRSVETGRIDYKRIIANGATLRMLVPDDEGVKQIVSDIQMEMPQIEFGYIDKSLQTGMSLLLVDSTELVVWEMKDDTKDDPQEAIGRATYSNSKSLVQSLYQIYGLLWKQTELYDTIKKHNKMQSEFVNIAAHEIRTPVQPILGMAEILESQFTGEKLEITKEEMELIIRNARRLERLTTDILEVTKIESGSLKLNKQTLDLNIKVQNVARDAKDTIPASKKNSVQLVVEPQPQPLLVSVDKSRVYEVIANLLGNAIKFTNNGNIVISTEKKKYDGKDYALVTVKDQGAGIDPEMISRLFTKFASKSQQGTGLGLFIARSIVEAHGGKIWGENNPDGRGATFRFTLPLAA
jgi:two-component system, OmpR family, sensor histidine kinase VicK